MPIGVLLAVFQFKGLGAVGRKAALKRRNRPGLIVGVQFQKRFGKFNLAQITQILSGHPRPAFPDPGGIGLNIPFKCSSAGRGQNARKPAAFLIKFLLHLHAVCHIFD